MPATDLKNSIRLQPQPMAYAMLAPGCARAWTCHNAGRVGEPQGSEHATRAQRHALSGIKLYPNTAALADLFIFRPIGPS